jgi:hypothetical protein
MRVVMPYAGAPCVAAQTALLAQAPDAEMIDVGGDACAYWRLLSRVWRECAASLDDLLVVEHDVEIAAGTLEALDACAEDWCSCPAHGWGGFDPAVDRGTFWTAALLQCNRWRHSFIVAHLDIFDSVPMHGRDWHQLDCYCVGQLLAPAHVHVELLTTHPSHSAAEQHERRLASARWKAQHADTPLLRAVATVYLEQTRASDELLTRAKAARRAHGDDAALDVITAERPELRYVPLRHLCASEAHRGVRVTDAPPETADGRSRARLTTT